MMVNFFLLTTLCFLCGCVKNSTTTYQPEFSKTEPVLKKKIIVFGVHPLHNPERLFSKFNPLMTYLEKRIPEIKFELEASKDYSSFEKKLFSHKFDMALPNPYQTVKAVKKGYQVFAKMNDDDNFRGILLVKKDGPIKRLEDLKNKTITFPAKTALAGSMMPQYLLFQKGFNLKTDITIKYVGSQESSVLSVYHDESSAAATWPGAWNLFKIDRPEIAEKLKELARTDSLPSNSLVFNSTMETALKEKIKYILLSLSDDPEGLAVLNNLQLSKFVSADNKSYKPVEDFIKEFESSVERIDDL